MNKPIESDGYISSALEFVLKYNIPLDWDVYEGIGEDSCKKFVATPGYSKREDDWLYLGGASKVIQTQLKGVWKW